LPTEKQDGKDGLVQQMVDKDIRNLRLVAICGYLITQIENIRQQLEMVMVIAKLISM
jgi:hypothetical protein